MTFDVLTILTELGFVNIRDFGKEFRATPIYRYSDNPNSFCVNKTTGEWYDFGISSGGSISQLVKLIKKFTSQQEVEDYLSKLGYRHHKSEYDIALKEQHIFNKELLLRLTKDHRYWINRKISLNTLELFDGGTSCNGKMAGRYVFPIFNEKQDLVGFAGRRLSGNENFSKWKLLGTKSKWVFPLHLNASCIQSKREVIIVESIGDALSLWDCGIKNILIAFGTNISISIVETLIKLDLNQIIIAFNNDMHNNLIGNIAAEKNKETLLKYFDNQQIRVSLPEGKDFGEMTCEQITLWHQNLNH